MRVYNKLELAVVYCVGVRDVTFELEPRFAE